MHFVALVDQVLALLRQRGQVTYRTLQRQFQLDADALADVLGELHYAHQETLHEDEQGLIRQAAHNLQAGVYGWFVEGFDTADLQEAQTLLAELS